MTVKKRLIYSGVLIAIVAIFLYVNNNWIVTTEHDYTSEQLPKHFDGFRITQVSDLHDGVFGQEQARLVEKVRATKPDVIFITGDLVDSRRYNLEQSLQAVEQFTQIADVYYVLGNHEVALNKMDEIYAALTALGVHVLRNEAIALEHSGEQMLIAGIEDPLMGSDVETMLTTALSGTDNLFTLLLSHRPEVFDTYTASDVDVVFTGHAHGGQVRLPFIGGIVAPGQGLFPTYTAGLHEKDGTTMVVSRGLGNSVFPFRIFNLPEIVVMELHHQ